jgi:uncharacterized protein (DUF1800 family)
MVEPTEILGTPTVQNEDVRREPGRRDLLRNPWSAAMVALGGVALAACDFTSASYDRNVHLLRRLTFGPTPATLARIRSIGENAWLDEQFAPSSLDSSAMNAKLAQLPALTMSAVELATTYPVGVPAPGWQLQFAALLRAVLNPAQLHERMVEFWNDHFNIYFEDRLHQRLKIIDDRDVIRPRALTTFSDLLVATAQSPVMLVYLDNYISTAGAINENYGRELLELHTVGVDGGYTEDDVVAVSRLLTGWTIERSTGTFAFRSALHDPAPLTIMGWTRPTSGTALSHGVQFLQWLAMRPATARHVCTKIARRFVSDAPSPSLVNAMAAAWSANGSSIPAVLRAMVGHADFAASASLKYRRPSDYLPFVLRALGADVVVPTAPSQLGAFSAVYSPLHQTPFMWDAPDGYPDDEASWLSAGADLARWNLVGVTATNRIPQFVVNLGPLAAGLPGRTAHEVYSAISRALVHEDTTSLGRDFLNRQLGWTTNLRPSASQIATALPTIAIASLISADAQYR